MPIFHSDRISGTIYAIADSAEHAGDMALNYLQDKGENRGHDHHGVFDHKEEATAFLRDAFRAHEPEERVYAISLNIHVASEE
ncbi:hypothetical protein [Streptomyces sp. NPDC008150]|uniref:hypothetical protein n=1 Tax=Streptomyces sp. NPDC008150 TaxID=3364816 RepID=UPI0036E03E09